MEKSKYEVIQKKLESAYTFADVRKRITDEELIAYFLYDYDSECLKNGDERLIFGIIRIIAENEPSIKRSVALLDATKYVLGFLCRLHLN